MLNILLNLTDLRSDFMLTLGNLNLLVALNNLALRIKLEVFTEGYGGLNHLIKHHQITHFLEMLSL